MYLLRPKSRGGVFLRSKDPYDRPVIDPNYLSHPDDIQDLVNGELMIPPCLDTRDWRQDKAYIFFLHHKPLVLIGFMEAKVDCLLLVIWGRF